MICAGPADRRAGRSLGRQVRGRKVGAGPQAERRRHPAELQTRRGGRRKSIGEWSDVRPRGADDPARQALPLQVKALTRGGCSIIRQNAPPRASADPASAGTARRSAGQQNRPLGGIKLWQEMLFRHPRSQREKSTVPPRILQRPRCVPRDAIRRLDVLLLERGCHVISDKVVACPRRRPNQLSRIK